MSAKWWPDPMTSDMRACIMPNHNPISGGLCLEGQNTLGRKLTQRPPFYSCITSSDSFQHNGVASTSGWTAHPGSRSSTTPWGKHLLATRQLECCDLWGTIWKKLWIDWGLYLQSQLPPHHKYDHITEDAAPIGLPTSILPLFVDKTLTYLTDLTY